MYGQSYLLCSRLGEYGTIFVDKFRPYAVNNVEDRLNIVASEHQAPIVMDLPDFVAENIVDMAKAKLLVGAKDERLVASARNRNACGHGRYSPPSPEATTKVAILSTQIVIAQTQEICAGWNAPLGVGRSNKGPHHNSSKPYQ